MTPSTAARALAATFLVSGTAHLAAPRLYDPLIPPVLPGPARWWTYGSGACELACAAGLLRRRSRPAAAQASAVLLAGVFPGNAWMAWRWRRRPPMARLVAYGRLPLQVPLVMWARYSGRG